MPSGRLAPWNWALMRPDANAVSAARGLICRWSGPTPLRGGAKFCAHFVIFGGSREMAETKARGSGQPRTPAGTASSFAFLGIRVCGTKLAGALPAIRENVIDPAPTMQPIYYFSPYIDLQAWKQELTPGLLWERGPSFSPFMGQ